MRSVGRIGTLENTRRIDVLRQFRDEVVEYFEHSEPDGPHGERSEDERAVPLRQSINGQLHEVARILRAAGIASGVTYRDPPLAGGRASRFDLLFNLFGLTDKDISHLQVLDCLDRGIGEYVRDARSARWRTWNPLFWLGVGLEWLAERPFVWLGRAGFNQTAIEQSVLGRLLRFLFFVVGAVASVLTILEVFGLLGSVKKALGLATA